VNTKESDKSEIVNRLGYIYKLWGKFMKHQVIKQVTSQNQQNYKKTVAIEDYYHECWSYSDRHRGPLLQSH